MMIATNLLLCSDTWCHVAPALFLLHAYSSKIVDLFSNDGLFAEVCCIFATCALCVTAVRMTACSVSDAESAGIRLPGQVAAVLHVKFHQTKWMQMSSAANAHRAYSAHTHTRTQTVTDYTHYLNSMCIWRLAHSHSEQEKIMVPSLCLSHLLMSHMCLPGLNSALVSVCILFNEAIKCERIPCVWIERLSWRIKPSQNRIPHVISL